MSPEKSLDFLSQKLVLRPALSRKRGSGKAVWAKTDPYSDKKEGDVVGSTRQRAHYKSVAGHCQEYYQV